MIDQLKGIVEQKTLNYAVLFVNGVGYKLTMSINGLDSLPSKGKEAHVLTYLHVREDILNLYGFANEKERNAFHLLVSISGIGPKLGLTILSGIDPSRLKDRVIAGDIAALTSVSGVGAKTAKRIIVELKEKFIKTNDDSLGFDEESGAESSLFKDVVNALTSLGYKVNHAKRACEALDKKGELKGELETVIKKALQQLIS
ncbi:MAG: Holliday junction branch migration protein RuvA [Candidatus Marinimicrobia bacterium]|jgi:Holliday junction DNA helicase RuvA|nr:Holliday junction branch migration protein RuvA [Candidatus Neomarinimicrobiota bacterium]MBT3501425.1 Holliday junction branch migration protein RuvA [Candidatus Neomarinimicrobiota bacterium]MBT3839436.1 Holliday junction branch migration protein RuvA [Candidatus Neomarinimicrobiota bacterium]MBT3998579.1 Holliday junction branch migration protein RuvA [Candidatus Neomarinimicrobiota bacterium]MBT4283051.1 Holliday junction branch migration protein RuvA [Candidatus Neomarinimicrobiota bact